MTEAEFVVRYIRRGSSRRRTAYVRRWDESTSWMRISVSVAEQMIRNGRAVEDDRGGRPA